MTNEDIIRAFVPPVFFALKRRITGAPKPPTSFSPRASFAEAKAEAGIGYSDAGLLLRYAGSYDLTKMQSYAAAALAAVALASKTADGCPIRVLDFGGASGYLRCYARDFFRGAIKTDWHIVETAEQVQFNEHENSDDFRFSTSIEQEPYVLAIFSGSLNYADDWRTTLSDVQTSDLILISRLPTGETEQAYLQTSIRNGTAYRFAGRVVPRVELFDLLSQTHDLFASWDEQSHLEGMGVYQSPAMLWKRR